jgi:hypothetical protein
MSFYIVQPYVSGPDRFHKATIVRSFNTAAEAFAELDRVGARLDHFGIAGDAIELVVVDEERKLVKRERVS